MEAMSSQLITLLTIILIVIYLIVITVLCCKAPSEQLLLRPMLY